MYYYIFDSYLNEPIYETTVQDINAILNELTVHGERARISPVRRLPDIMRDAFNKKIDTVVMVGNEGTFSKAIDYAVEMNFTLGYLPVEEEDPLGIQMGLHSPDQAGRALQTRRVEELYPVRVNDEFFLTRLDAHISDEEEREPKKKGFFGRFFKHRTARDIKILFDENYFVSGKFEELSIFNTRSESDNPLVSKKSITPYDQTFEVAFKTQIPKYKKMKKETGVSRDTYNKMSPYNLLKAKKIEILEPSGMEMIAGSTVIAKTPCVIMPSQKRLKLIVGGEREF